MARAILITGADGMLGSALVRAGIRNGIEVVGLRRQELDITNTYQVERVLSRYEAPIVINCAGIVKGRSDVKGYRMLAVNAQGPQILARYAGRLVQVSTDCVFDGRTSYKAYAEDDSPAPEDAYGRWKLLGEVTSSPHLTVRVSFVGLGQRGLLKWLLERPCCAQIEGFRNWLWNGWTASALADQMLSLAGDPWQTGLLHLPGPAVMTKGWLLTEVAQRLRPDITVVLGDAPEPRKMLLESNTTLRVAPSTNWDQMLAELAEEYRTSQALSR